MFAQSGFIEYLGTNPTLSTAEYTIKNQLIQSDSFIDASWVCKVNPILNYLVGNTVEVQLPDWTTPIIFTSSQVSAQSGSDYYWSGTGPNGSSLSIRKSNAGAVGSIVAGGTSFRYYTISGLSFEKCLIKKQNTDIIESETEHDDDEYDNFETPEHISTERCGNNTIRVLYLFTDDAAGTGEDFNMLADLMISELKSSCLASGLPPSAINFEKANVLPVSDFQESIGKNVTKTFKKLLDSDEAKSKRNQSYADVVVLFCRGRFKNAQGDANNFASSEGAYCCTTISAAKLRFKATHGVGHLIGARHQRDFRAGHIICDAPSVHPLDFAHGFQMGASFKTIMSDFECDVPSRTRIGNWSSPLVAVSATNSVGLTILAPTGTLTNFNALRLSQRAGEVSCFRGDPIPLPPLAVCDIEGPTYICIGNSGLFTTTCTTGTLNWDWSLNGFTWFPLGTGSSVNFTPGNSYGTAASVQVRLTSGTYPNTYQDINTVVVVDCPGGVPPGDDRNSSELKDDEIVEIPITVLQNPTSTEFYLKGALPLDEVIVLNSNGKLILKKLAEEITTIDMSDQSPGLYFIQVKNEKYSKQFKAIKL